MDGRQAKLRMVGGEMRGRGRGQTAAAAARASPPLGGLANTKTLAEETGEAAAGRIDGQGGEKSERYRPLL